MSKRRLTLAFSGLLLVAGLSWSFKPDYFEISKQLEIFTSIFKELNLYYVDDTEAGELANEAINAMLASLDPYTNYIPEERVEDYKIQHTGNYGGIGANVRSFEDQAILMSIYPGFAADKAGLQVGDRLLAVDGNDLKGKSADEISEYLKGSPGSSFELRFERQGKEMTKKVTREVVHINSVPYAGMLDDGVAYIALTSFTQNAHREIREAWEALEAEHGVLRGLVLDLRDNPGGLLSEAIAVSNLFLPKGLTVVSTKGKQEEWRRTYKTEQKPKDTAIAVAVLINGASASASEIVAGTLQDYDRALVIGERSFGKGLVQEQRKLPYGAQLKVTIAKYYTPSGRLIQAIDYSGRTKDGRLEKLPDSLRTRFFTRAGRPVFDGGGIDPDTSTHQPLGNALLLALIRELKIFRYASLYLEKNGRPTEAPRDFQLSAKEYSAFEEWLSAQDFDYEDAASQALQRLRKSLPEEERSAELKALLRKMEEELYQERQAAIRENRDVLRNLLQEEIVARYAYEEGRIANALQHDADIEVARELLVNPQMYQGLLQHD